MQFIKLISSVAVLAVIACQSGAGGKGVATTGERAPTPEAQAGVDSSQAEEPNRAVDDADKQQAKIQAAAMREEAREEAAREDDREAAERWRAGAEERLQAEAGRARQENEAEEDVPRRN